MKTTFNCLNEGFYQQEITQQEIIQKKKTESENSWLYSIQHIHTFFHTLVANILYELSWSDLVFNN